MSNDDSIMRRGEGAARAASTLAKRNKDMCKMSDADRNARPPDRGTRCREERERKKEKVDIYVFG
jgi:hypothetical protein